MGDIFVTTFYVISGSSTTAMTPYSNLRWSSLLTNHKHFLLIKMWKVFVVDKIRLGNLDVIVQLTNWVIYKLLLSTSPKC